MSQQTAPPSFWEAFLCRYLPASPALAKSLWRHYKPACGATTARWQLYRCEVAGLPAMENVLYETLTPAALMRTLEAAFPPGTERPRAARELEDRVLAATTAAGTWR